MVIILLIINSTLFYKITSPEKVVFRFFYELREKSNTNEKQKTIKWNEIIYFIELTSFTNIVKSSLFLNDQWR